MRQSNRKRVLVLGAGIYYRRLIEQLCAAGFYVIAVDRDPSASAAQLVDEFTAIDVVDKEAVLSLARNRAIDGVMPINDFGTRTAAYVAQELGLVGLEIQTAEAANDKGIMRDVWQEAELPMPRYRIVRRMQDLRRAVSEFGFPCVLKPTDCGGGGRGISTIGKKSEIEWAYNFAKPYAKNGRFILEEFINGVEMTIESLSVGGEVKILAMSDKVKPDIRTRVATSLNYPAAIDGTLSEKVKRLVEKAVLSVGIFDGMAHTEVIVTESSPKLIELGARGGGGHVFHTCIEATSGVRAPVVLARLLTGSPVRLPEIQSKGCVYRFFNPRRGILKGVVGIREASQLGGVLDIGITKKVGDEVGNLENSLQRTGFVVTAGKSREEAVALADYVETIVRFDIEPLGSVVEHV